jgi:hypothetical protein
MGKQIDLMSDQLSWKDDKISQLNEVAKKQVFLDMLVSVKYK